MVFASSAWMRPGRLLVGLVSLLLVTACGGRAVTAQSGSDAAPDANVPPTPEGEVPTPAAPDASAGGGCPETLAQACKTPTPPGQLGISCQPTWALALADTEYCQTVVPFAMQASCGQYNELAVVDADWGYSYYYDKATGKLVAVFIFGGTGGPDSMDCVGGPAGFVPPACGASHETNACSTDAGVDSGPG